MTKPYSPSDDILARLPRARRAEILRQIEDADALTQEAAAEPKAAIPPAPEAKSAQPPWKPDANPHPYARFRRLRAEMRDLTLDERREFRRVHDGVVEATGDAGMAKIVARISVDLGRNAADATKEAAEAQTADKHSTAMAQTKTITVAMPPEGYKVCSKCHETLRLSAYYRDRANRTGRTSRCKPCWLASYRSHGHRRDAA